jgi:hypothetical protein
VGEGERDEREELAGLEAAEQLVEGGDLVRQDELPQLLDVGATVIVITITVISSPRGLHKEGGGGRWRRQRLGREPLLLLFTTVVLFLYFYDYSFLRRQRRRRRLRGAPLLQLQLFQLPQQPLAVVRRPHGHRVVVVLRKVLPQGPLEALDLVGLGELDKEVELV